MLTSLHILPTIQAFHFNASSTQFTYNKTPGQNEPLNKNLSILTNQPDKSAAFLQVTPAHQNIEDKEQFKLEKRELQPSIQIPPSPNIDHPPIHILSDSDFANQGWPGSGNETHPYHIANLNINASGTASDCIGIHNTQAHFIIANCNLFGDPPYMGINLFNTVNATLRNNTCLNLHTGIQITGSKSITIHNNTFSDIVYGIHVKDGSHNNTLQSNTFNHKETWSYDPIEYTSIYLDLSSHNTIADNKCYHTRGPSIHLSFSDQNIVRNNTCNSWGDDAITLWHSHHNDIINNYFQKTIRIETSQSNTIQGNQFPGPWYSPGGPRRAIVLNYASLNNRIINNTGFADDCFIEILLEDIIFVNNSLWGCEIKVSCPDQYFNESKFQGNTIDGRPIVFRSNQTDISITTDAAQILIFSCHDVVIEELDMSSGPAGVQIFYSTNITIRRNHFEIRPGIQLVSCESCTLTENTYISPWGFREGKGIELQRCNDCDIYNNRFQNLNLGIVLTESTEVVISENEFVENYCGVLAEFSYSIVITKNLCEANTDGITLVFGSKNVISENSCFLNMNGIVLNCARASILRNNNCTRNLEYGIYLQGGGSNSLENNHCCFNRYGIHFQSENRTTSIGNSLSHNGYGIYLDDESSFNQILHNDFMDNLLAQAWNDGRNNVFDGNYWSDYTGWDLNFDGYGELPYIIPGQIEARDYRPRGDTFLLTRQMWVWILIVCLFLIATVILGRHISILAKGEVPEW
jgi:parallel beta-helix repeat protein